MSKDLNRAFVEDPVGFASQLPVVPPGAQARDGQTKSFSGVSEQFKGVPGHLRIIAGDLMSKGSYAQLTLAYDNLDDRLDQGWMALYYLPWIEDHVVRVALRPRSKTTRGGAVKQHVIDQLLIGNNGYQEDPNYPDIFFTAAVDGCMVIVDGSPTQPVVYHANRKGMDTDTYVGADDDERVPKMIEDLKAFQVASPKNTRGAADPAVAGAGATAAMYMPFDRRNQLAQNPVTVVPKQSRSNFTKAMGAVFGLRRDDTWAFYYERLLKSDTNLWEPKTFLCIPMGGAWGAPSPTFQLDATISKFWPGGTGHAIG